MSTCPFSDGKGEAPHPLPAQHEIKEEPIPQPPTHLFGLLGNFPDMDPSFPVRGFWKLTELYGPIYKLALDKEQVVIATQQYMHEICDPDRFEKIPPRAQQEIRALTGDGLFTAFPTEQNWHVAHRMLIPAFGPLGIRKMFDEMLDITSQMVLRWDRYGPNHRINSSDDFTRLAFDTIGLCAFGYRFNEFYTDEAHPFAKQMGNVLKLSGARSSRTNLENRLHRAEEQERQSDVKKMHDLCREVVQARKSQPPTDRKDLLSVMLDSVDRETGAGLSEENIIYQLATFLVAGHETTSATLSFMWYNLLKNPEKFQKIQKEVDEVVGDRVLTIDMLSKLHYVDACIKETLRLSSPIALIDKTAKQDTYLGGKYFIKKGQSVKADIKALHHDPAVWGDNHDEFEPERMLDGKFQALPPDSWKPFGDGVRACIGRGFAEQEMLINTALILQRFQPELADPGYVLELHSTLTIKPGNFFMKMRRRPGRSFFIGLPGGGPTDIAKMQQAQQEGSRAAASPTRGGAAIPIFYGGNQGTCESFAQTLQSKLGEVGRTGTVHGLDIATENFSNKEVNVIITSSYEGKPPDNAKKFVSWLESLEGADRLKGIKYSVLGVGNSDWAATFHRIPKLVDEAMEKLGAERVLAANYCNVKADLMGPYDEWSDELLHYLSGSSKPAVEKTSLSVSVQRSKLAQDLGDENMNIGTVLENREIADNSVGPAKKHMEIRLAEGATYKAGDYLVVQPTNPPHPVRRVMRFFGFSNSDMMSVRGSSKTFLPSESTSVATFLFSNVELATPVTKRQLKTLSNFADGEVKQQLEKLQEGEAYADLLKKRYSVIDVLEDHHTALPFEEYVDMLLPLTPRQYSISSSSMAPGHADVLSVTYDVHISPATSGHGQFEGVASNFLASRRPGDRISCFVRPTNVGFRLPGNAETPVIMFAAGTGIAPMRSFIQERATIAEAGVRKLGPAILFFGCRHQDKDYLYREELAEWEKKGVVQVKPAFSQMEGGDKKYVQDLIWENKDTVADMFENGGKVYLCGSAARLGKSCGDVSKKIMMERTGKSEAEAEEWLQDIKTDRYVSDVY
ncbi:cytochrome P450 [Polychaeton citri CBS 116435]|uniref:Bifunctional cytochrome P450/NADPH--P450 reductase n=1 Tax=Polychaeton citri CBS 116435 TaxID=1314669 RepID=A0A9P4Q8T7_9PEZI|nr:cytochrome P450 [Polychaeton citri CBS 116435]